MQTVYLFRLSDMLFHVLYNRFCLALFALDHFKALEY